MPGGLANEFIICPFVLREAISFRDTEPVVRGKKILSQTQRCSFNYSRNVTLSMKSQVYINVLVITGYHFYSNSSFTGTCTSDDLQLKIIIIIIKRERLKEAGDRTL